MSKIPGTRLTIHDLVEKQGAAARAGSLLSSAALAGDRQAFVDADIAATLEAKHAKLGAAAKAPSEIAEGHDPEIAAQIATFLGKHNELRWGTVLAFGNQIERAIVTDWDGMYKNLIKPNTRKGDPAIQSSDIGYFTTKDDTELAAIIEQGGFYHAFWSIRETLKAMYELNSHHQKNWDEFKNTKGLAGLERKIDTVRKCIAVIDKVLAKNPDITSKFPKLVAFRAKMQANSKLIDESKSKIAELKFTREQEERLRDETTKSVLDLFDDID